MAVSGLNFEHPSQKDVYTYPNMFMKTYQLKFISALDPLREWRSYFEVKESFEISSVFISVFNFKLSAIALYEKLQWSFNKYLI